MTYKISNEDLQDADSNFHIFQTQEDDNVDVGDEKEKLI